MNNFFELFVFVSTSTYEGFFLLLASLSFFTLIIIEDGLNNVSETLYYRRHSLATQVQSHGAAFLHLGTT